MTLHDVFEEVLELQDDWSSENTDEMRRRGELIRRDGPELIRAMAPQLAAAMGPSGSDLIIEGRDGTGRKTEIPWIRFASKSRSSGAQDGWYCVFLFHAQGAGMYLSLMHGSTQFVDGQYVPRSDEELRGHVMWAQRAVANELLVADAILQDIDLGTSRTLGQAYQKSSAVALWHERGQIPDDDVLESELISFASMLRELYDAVDLGRAPGSNSPEVAALEFAAEDVARPNAGDRRNKGQGFGLSAEERRIVELHAMTIAADVLRGEEYDLRDVSGTHPYDFVAVKDGEELIVEVKGTTSELGSIVLTASEVDAHRARHPRNMLIIVHSIDLQRSPRKPVASGGEVQVIRPWLPIEDNLRPISFQYRVVEEGR